MRTTRPLMRATAALLGCWLWWPSSHANTATDSPEVRQLLENARYWAAHNRPDLVRQLMRKLLAIHPRHPEALLALGLAPSAPPAKIARTPAPASAPVRTRRAQPEPKKAQPPPAPSIPDAQPDAAPSPDAPPLAPVLEANAANAGTPLDIAEAPAVPKPEEPQDHVGAGLEALWAALDQNRVSDGLRLGQELSAKYPDRPDVTRALALALRDAGKRGQARLGLELAMRQSLEAPSSLQWVARESRNALQALDDRRQPELATGLTLVHKPGDEAVSRLDSRVASFRVRQPWGDHGHWFGQLDSFQLEAGRTDTAQLARAGHWGSAALAPTPELVAAPVHAHARGTAMVIGYEADRWRVDIGTTPIGFEFSSISAGLGLKGRLGSTDWSVSLAHRPVTGSLLSYAGQRDSFSGIRWGAVRRTSALLQLGTTWKGLEPFAQIEVAGYRGREVLPNHEHGVALGVDWVLRRGTDHYAAIGPVVRFRAFDNNQNHYSVGHGGYYSPQRSTTLSLPVQAAMRSTHLSWLLRVAPSWSHSSTSSALRFPTRADLQARAAAQGRATYGGSSGPGAGWALQSTLEYRMNAHWVTGMRVAAERSPDYERNQVHFYLRWHEKPQRGPVPLWPSTVMPHAGL